MEIFLNGGYKGNPRGTVMVLLGSNHTRVDSQEISEEEIAEGSEILSWMAEVKRIGLKKSGL